jgi:hypothetical protein
MSQQVSAPTISEALARHAEIIVALEQPGLDPQEKAAAVGLLLQIDEYLGPYFASKGKIRLTSFSTYLKPKKIISKK